MDHIQQDTNNGQGLYWNLKLQIWTYQFYFTLEMIFSQNIGVSIKGFGVILEGDKKGGQFCDQIG